ncbi:MAG: 4-phosphoerythronate dehydrogenase [Muribaculaceae bacterium]|nr:4-phosphoerythronate dehydrogenase [Muribaculaceae bacterium]
MKIIADKNIPFIEGRIKGADLITLPAPAIDKETIKDADALIVRTRTRCDASLLKDSKVKIIATATIGTDHIDIPWCTQHGITVRNAPGCNAPGVALYVWASLLRHGFDPEKSVLGVIGCGNVGGIVARWGERLGVRILVCDPPRQELGLKDYDYLPLDEVMAHSDAITVHTPLTMNGNCPTYHMINEISLGSLKHGAIFVNAARGEVAETESICRAISEGRIRHAIIDTWENEPHIDRRLLSLADVATCHIAGYSVEGKQRATRMALEAVSETIGVPVDTEGLQDPYKEPGILSASRIVGAYDPAAMTAALKADPSRFEALRNAYPLHAELL